MKRAATPLAQGFEETEAIAVIDILRRAQIGVLATGVAVRLANRPARK